MNPPPRLALVHDIAWRLQHALAQRWPTLVIDADHVRFDGATHDLEKLLHPHELTEPDQQHAADGSAFLITAGVKPHYARFSRTHRIWRNESLPLEDLSLPSRIPAGKVAATLFLTTHACPDSG